MDDLKFSLSAISCAFFSSLIWLIQFAIRTGPVMLFLYYYLQALYLILYLISCIGLISLVRKQRIPVEKKYFTFPLIITIIGLALTSLAIVLISVITKKFPYPPGTDLIFHLQYILSLLLVPFGMLFLYSFRSLIHEDLMIFLIFMTGFSLISLVTFGLYLLAEVQTPLSWLSHLATTLSGLFFLVIASKYNENENG